jgi:hypothetical protein
VTGLKERYDDVLQQLADEYEGKGYEVKVHARIATVAGAPLDADLLATRGDETVLLQVKLATAASATPAIRQYAEVAQQKGWRFIIAVADSKGVEEVDVPTMNTVREKIAETRAIEAKSTAAPLLAWSVLEAAARFALARAGTRVVRAKSPSALVQELASLGLVTSKEERQLQAFARTRNRLAHGSWDAPHEPNDVEFALVLAERLIAEDSVRGPE